LAHYIFAHERLAGKLAGLGLSHATAVEHVHYRGHQIYFGADIRRPSIAVCSVAGAGSGGLSHFHPLIFWQLHNVAANLFKF
jgi:hypothetical protein